MLNTFYKQPL